MSILQFDVSDSLVCETSIKVAIAALPELNHRPRRIAIEDFAE